LAAADSDTTLRITKPGASQRQGSPAVRASRRGYCETLMNTPVARAAKAVIESLRVRLDPEKAAGKSVTVGFPRDAAGED